MKKRDNKNKRNKDPPPVTFLSTEKTEYVGQVFATVEKVASEIGEKRRQGDPSMWTVARPHMSLDFADRPSLNPPPPISVIPNPSQQNILLDDLLSVLLGFQGRYITSPLLNSLHEPRVFNVDPSVDPLYRNLLEKILPLAADHSLVERFVEEKRILAWGRVNQALCGVLSSLLHDYKIFIATFEDVFNKMRLDFELMWIHLQQTMATFKVLARIVNSINQKEAKGGATLSILQELTLHYIADDTAQQLCLFLTKAAAVPYFESLQRWIDKGIVFDPFTEFMIQDNKNVEIDDTNKKTGLYTDAYWAKRYTVCQNKVPSFLTDVQEMILRTGRYLNVVRQCTSTTKTTERKREEEKETRKKEEKKLIYTKDGDHYLPQIEAAYQSASTTLLNMLMDKYDIVNRIKSLKRYFLMEQGDFIMQLLDLCEDELMKPISDVVPSRILSLFELALRTSSGKHDPYKDDITLRILETNNTHEIMKLQSIEMEIKGDVQMTMEESLVAGSRTGLEGLVFQVVSKFPVSLLFNQKIIGCYQMLFRHLLLSKHVERRLCRVWISDSAVKQLPRTQAKHYLPAFSLRHRMLCCIQNLSYYMTIEAIEPNWRTFINRISSVRNIDDLLNEHEQFLMQCMQDCMFNNHDLLVIINNILASCINFCDFMQTSEGVPVENQSFEKNIERLDMTFSSYQVTLLATISGLAVKDDTVEKLRNILYRENFNGYFTSKIERDQFGSEFSTHSG